MNLNSMLTYSTIVIALIFGSVSANGQESAADSTSAKQEKDLGSKQKPSKEAVERFKKMMNQSVLIGNFTVVGQKKELTPEEYRIESVKKTDEGDYWMFKVQIKYNSYNVKVNIPLQIKWAGDTPVVTLDGDKIPGLGKFNARVLFHENKYSGTWSHDDVGGHLFGTIKPQQDAKSEKSKGSVDSSGGESK